MILAFTKIQQVKKRGEEGRSESARRGHPKKKKRQKKGATVRESQDSPLERQVGRGNEKNLEVNGRPGFQICFYFSR